MKKNNLRKGSTLLIWGAVSVLLSSQSAKSEELALSCHISRHGGSIGDDIKTVSQSDEIFYIDLVGLSARKDGDPELYELEIHDFRLILRSRNKSTGAGYPSQTGWFLKEAEIDRQNGKITDRFEFRRGDTLAGIWERGEGSCVKADKQNRAF